MDIITKATIMQLTNEDVIVDAQALIEVEGREIEISRVKTAYNNTESSRFQFQEAVAEKFSAVYEATMIMWDNNHIIDDEIHSEELETGEGEEQSGECGKYI